MRDIIEENARTDAICEELDNFDKYKKALEIIASFKEDVFDCSRCLAAEVAISALNKGKEEE